MPGFPVLHYLPEFAQTPIFESIMPSNHLILCCSLLLLSSIFPSISIFSKELVLHIRWPKYWSFSLSISPSNEYSVLISYRIDWFDLHHCYIRQDIFTALKILYVLPIQPSLCQTLFKISPPAYIKQR